LIGFETMKWSSQTLNFFSKNIELCDENRQCFICNCSPLVASDGICNHERGGLWQLSQHKIARDILIFILLTWTCMTNTLLENCKETEGGISYLYSYHWYI
jgi:hypothetical protein